MKYFTAFGVGLCLLIGLLVYASPSTAAASGPDTFASETIKRTNVERTKRKVPALKYSTCLTGLAAAHAKAQARKRTMYHQSMKTAMKKCTLRAVGENVAAGFTSPQSVIAGWMRSAGHRANILSKSFKSIGVARAKGSNGRWYYAQVFGTAR